ncbi:hypothetical protein [Vibrio nigripulchritudo]|nr:hypothetical protein [Vibrio nigripulchritudo]
MENLNTTSKANEFLNCFLQSDHFSIADSLLPSLDRSRLNLSYESLDYLFESVLTYSCFDNSRAKQGGPFWTKYDAMYAISNKYSVETLYFIDLCTYYFGNVLVRHAFGAEWGVHCDQTLKGRLADYNGKYTPCIENVANDTFSCPIFFLFYNKLRKALIHGLDSVLPVSLEAKHQVLVLNGEIKDNHNA